MYLRLEEIFVITTLLFYNVRVVNNKSDQINIVSNAYQQINVWYLDVAELVESISIIRYTFGEIVLICHY